MLQMLGCSSIEKLLQIPENLLLPKISVDDGLSEMEGLQLMRAIGKKNSFSELDSYLGAGAYDHYVPAIVAAICQRSEFLTSYTPYQAEASQGMLQAIFEYQTAICALTGMEAANASVYDGANACAEALAMALRARPEKNRLLVSAALHPHYRRVIDLYFSRRPFEIITIPYLENGALDQERLAQFLNGQTAACLLASPNFFGIVEEFSAVAALLKQQEAISILCANPLAYGIYQPAGGMGFDIAVGDSQPFGLPLQYGGPYSGYMACRRDLLRQLPGRIAGETTDAAGRRGFVLTLQAREQHIRREKATSNICTNQALASLASLIALLWYGKQGIKELALHNYQNARWLQNQLQDIFPGFQTPAILNEFTLNFGRPVEQVQAYFRKHDIEPGLSLAEYYPELTGWFLLAVTETKTDAQLKRFVEVAKRLKSDG